MLDLNIRKEELLKGVSQTQSIAEKRSSMPILSNVLLEVQENRLAITATDLEITFQGTYECNTKEEGRFTVPARKFYEIVRVLNDETFNLKELDNYNLAVNGERSNYRLHGLSPEDFPPMPDYQEVSFAVVDPEILLDMIEKTIYSIAVEETRYNLAGVYFEKAMQDDKSILRMVSTDGHRLSLVEKAVPGLEDITLDKGVIVSRKGMNEMKKLAEEGQPVSLGFAVNSSVIKGENVVLVIRLLEGRFPDYNLVIPKKNDKKLVIGRKDFLEMLRRISVMSSDDYKGVKFSLTTKELTLSAVNPDLGEARESLPVEYEDEDMEIGFNPRYFIETLSSLKSDVITVAFQDGGNPCLITAPEDQGFVGVIMPMKI